MMAFLYSPISGVADAMALHFTPGKHEYGHEHTTTRGSSRYSGVTLEWVDSGIGRTVVVDSSVVLSDLRLLDGMRWSDFQLMHLYLYSVLTFTRPDVVALFSLQERGAGGYTSQL